MPSVPGTNRRRYWRDPPGLKSEGSALRLEPKADANPHKPPKKPYANAPKRNKPLTDKERSGLATAVEVLAAFKKLYAHPKRANVTRLNMRCPRKGCGGIIHSCVIGPKRHLRFQCDNTNDCGIMGME